MVADEIGIGVEELHAVFEQLSRATVLALDGLWTVSDSSGDQIALVDTLGDADTPDPFELLVAEIGDVIGRKRIIWMIVESAI